MFIYISASCIPVLAKRGIWSFNYSLSCTLLTCPWKPILQFVTSACILRQVSRLSFSTFSSWFEMLAWEISLTKLRDILRKTSDQYKQITPLELHQPDFGQSDGYTSRSRSEATDICLNAWHPLQRFYKPLELRSYTCSSRPASSSVSWISHLNAPVLCLNAPLWHINNFSASFLSLPPSTETSHHIMMLLSDSLSQPPSQASPGTYAYESWFSS